MVDFYASPAICQVADNHKSSTIRPSLKGLHPIEWSRDDVRMWMLWCVTEYGLDADLPDRFPMNGKGLCMLKKEDFCQRAPYYGDVIFNALSEYLQPSPHLLVLPTVSLPNTVTSFMTQLTGRSFSADELDDDVKENNLKYVDWSVKSAQSSPDVVMLSAPDDVFYAEGASKGRVSTERRHSPSTEYYSANYDSFEEDDQPLNLKIDSSYVDDASVDRKSSSAGTPDSVSERTQQSHGPCRLLWEFLAELLMDETRSQYICWEDRDFLTFRIVDPNGLAQLWGLEKCKKGMTYEKMSRALRYYYRLNIIAKVHGKRLTYRFLTAPACIKKGIRGAKPGVPHKRRTPRSPTTSPVAGKPRPIAPASSSDVIMAGSMTSPPTQITNIHSLISASSLQSRFDHRHTTIAVNSVNSETPNIKVESSMSTFHRDNVGLLVHPSRWDSALSPALSTTDSSVGTTIDNTGNLGLSRVSSRPSSVTDSCHRVPLFVSQFQMESPDGSLYDTNYSTPWTRSNNETKSFLTCQSP